MSMMPLIIRFLNLTLVAMNFGFWQHDWNAGAGCFLLLTIVMRGYLVEGP